MMLVQEGAAESYAAAYNLALEEVLLSKSSGEYFRLWQNRNAVIIGRNQNAYREINEEFTERNSIEIVRRLTGGGAVYHDLGNLNFSFFLPVKDGSRIDFKRFMTPIVSALKDIGISADISGRNDLTANGRKFSGNAQLIKDGRVLHHGTILVNSNLGVLSQALNVSKEKLKAKAVASVSSRVINLSELTECDGLNLTADALKSLIITRLPINSVYAVTDEDLAEAKQLEAEKYGMRRWNYGKEPNYDFRKELYIEGFGNIEIHFKLDDDIIEACKIYGDYFDNDRIQALEVRLTGQRFGGIDFTKFFGSF